MLVEAKWDRDGHTPSFNEYLRNGVVSSSGTVLAIHAFYLVMRDETTGEIERVLEKDHNNMIHNVCLIIRLCNDLGTSSVSIFGIVWVDTGSGWAELDQANNRYENT
ncbi:Alpha-farnesene synthase [Linum perenne]